MKAGKPSAFARPAPSTAQLLREGAGYFLAFAVVGTELITRITLIMLH